MIKDKLRDKLYRKLDALFDVIKEDNDYNIIFKETGNEVHRSFLDDYIFERIGEQQSIFDVGNLVNDWCDNRIKLLKRRR